MEKTVRIRDEKNEKTNQFYLDFTPYLRDEKNEKTNQFYLDFTPYLLIKTEKNGQIKRWKKRSE